MKAESLPVNEFLSESKGYNLIDVRAPVEFRKGHIPGAINIPLFDDLERAEIGTLYKAKGRENAIMRGLEIVSPKLTDFIKEVKKSSSDNRVFVYCFRGGMRSNSFGWLLNTAGLESIIMEGGYKAYRNHVLNHFKNAYNLILLGGATGSGKTEILHHLKGKIQILDLEKIAHHKGSAFGSINELPQFPQQLFENNLYNDLANLSDQKPILVEDESMSIGYNKIPYPFWLQMKAAPIIKVMVPFDLRVQRLVLDYGMADKNVLAKCIQNISQQLGPNNVKDCMQYLQEGNLADVAAITLRYYDKAYEYNHIKREIKKIITIETDTNDAAINALKVKETFENYGNL